MSKELQKYKQQEVTTPISEAADSSLDSSSPQITDVQGPDAS